MDDSMQTGAVLFVQDLQKVTDFYEEVACLRKAREEDDYALLERGEYQLVVHKIPDHYGVEVASSPPVARESSHLKLVFFVENIAESRSAISRCGGLLQGTEREWEFDGTLVCDGCDPEGNMIQLRQPSVG